MNIAGYLEEIAEIYSSGAATEHSYRAPLQRLFESVDDTATIINEAKRSEGGMPDFLFMRDGIAFGWAEAKDIDKDVIKLKGYSVEQRKRYENAYPNLLYTNGVDFEFIRDGDVIHHTSIADFMGELGGLKPLPEQFDELERQLKSFTQQKPISIKSAQKLAEMMAGKAAIIKDEVGIALKDDPEFASGLGRQFKTFKANLLPNLTPDEFADIYAETITYGMFAARLHDDTLDTFSRQEALEKLPKSNPFLRGLFQFIAGYDIPERLRYVVDDLAEVLRASDPHSLFAEFGKFTARNDPFIHFYETFLAAYNPKKRKARGVWYTPEPVVDFIVRAVDDVLKSEFDIADGLADTKKIKVKWDTGLTTDKGNPRYEDREVHRVQILDPATGTGTFLAKAVQMISDRVKGIAPGKWSSYVEEDLLPRLHGFELLMASYAMCHMKLDMQLTESGYVPSKNPPQGAERLSVWLTNALEPAEREVKDLFFQPLADEARGASEVKRQSPIMCVIGNPPYNIMSGNLSDSQVALVNSYRYVDGTKIKEKGMLQFEKNINNDYIKFLALSESLINRNQFGILGFVTSHSYLKSASFRGLRRSLMETFNRIKILDLHGNSEIREVVPDGINDENIFDIKQGVCVIIAVRNRCQPKDKKVLYADLWGSRDTKGEELKKAGLTNLQWQDCKPSSPNYVFHPSGAQRGGYDKDFFSVAQLHPVYSSGVITARDGFSISNSKIELLERSIAFAGNEALSDSELCIKLGIAEKKGWDISRARQQLNSIKDLSTLIKPISYRPFDQRNIIFHESVVWTTAKSTMQHMLRGQNLMLVSARSEKSGTCSHFYISENLVETKCGERTTQSAVFPLYLYPDDNAEQGDAFAAKTRTLNLDPKLYAKICKAAGIDPKDTDMAREASGDSSGFREATGDARPSEVKVFDYIYGVLHSPDYRETFAEFLKIDFPRVPYPASPKVFAAISTHGEALRRLHLMEAGAIGDAPFPFMDDGTVDEDRADDIVAPSYPKHDGGHVWINPHQYFKDVPVAAWEFYIGGYQPAQKWLKDRKGRALSFDDIKHYQKIIKILLETGRIMGEIKLPLETDTAAPETVA